MGIKNLNGFLRDNCKESIKCVSVSALAGKKIAVDISIYMYKFAGDDCLIEHMYLMLSIFWYYKIIPIFIFDGKAPAEKNALLKQRRDNKHDAEHEYKRIEHVLKTGDNIDDNEKQELLNSMDLLKKQFIYITKDKIAMVKDLIRSYGMTYFDAPGEADELCAMLVIKQKVWAVLTEDMDLFVYGCPRVLRYFSLMRHNVVLYETVGILQELGITQYEFRQICVLSGTDYNSGIKNGEKGLDKDKDVNCLATTLKIFRKYHKTKKDVSFYEWAKINTNYIHDYDFLKNVYELYNLTDNHNSIKIFENVMIANGPIMKHLMQPILEADGFLFPK